MDELYTRVSSATKQVLYQYMKDGYVSLLNYNFDYFFKQVEIFLDYSQYDIGNFEEMKELNLLDLRLYNMGPTTMEFLTGLPAPYKVIANEAFAILNSPILNDANHW